MGYFTASSGTPLTSRSVAMASLRAAVLALLLAGLPFVAALNYSTAVTFEAYVFDYNVDFQEVDRYGGSCECGEALDTLGQDRKLQYRGGMQLYPGFPPYDQYVTNRTCIPQCRNTGSSHYRQYFDSWLRDLPGYNVKIPIKLVFNLTDPVKGLYEFNRQSPSPSVVQVFSPVTGLGWGADHEYPAAFTGPYLPYVGFNYGFGLEVHATFKYNGTEVFNFGGDDDVFLFVNNFLVLDLGGLHPPVSANVSLASIAGYAGLVVGQRYTFDFFQFERHVQGSNCLIQTTLVPANSPPKVTAATYNVDAGQSLAGQFQYFDPDANVIAVPVYMPAAYYQPTSTTMQLPYIALSGAPSFTNFVFNAPLAVTTSTVPGVYTQTYTISFSAFDGEFTACNTTVTFIVSQTVLAQPPPPVFASPPPPRRFSPAASPILSKEATIGIAVAASVLFIAGIVALVLLLLYVRSRVDDWEKDVFAGLAKDGLIENPLFEAANHEYSNPMYDQK
eukprot:c11186_g1_i2.p1 GENE.c11186_g1_i2~~c11186_g1_i2.p1  ORF type:complete len:502 (+),score=105.20 c11186_g1_i2:1-1506(+)